MEKIINRRYQILEKVREERVFSLYLAYCQVRKQIVRLKLLRSPLSLDLRFVEELNRALQRIANLSHPNLMKVLDFGEEMGTFFVVEEYEEGEYLDKKIKQGIFPPERALSIILQVAEGLQYLEGNNLIHGQLRPESIWITKGGRVKITDLSLPSLGKEEMLSRADTYYSPPEEIRVGEAAKSSDIYSLGGIFFELLVGERPLTSKSFRPSLPKDLERIVLKMREKNIVKRYSRILDVLIDLKAYQKEAGMEKVEKEKEEEPIKREREVFVPRLEKEKITLTRRRKADRTLKGCLLIFLPFLVVAGLFSFLVYRFLIPLKDVAVPDVCGKSVSEAEYLLEESRLRHRIISKEYSLDVPLDHVIRQMPFAGKTVKEKKVIQLVISEGQEEAIVPDLRGLSLSEAKLSLEEAKLTLGQKSYQPSDSIPKGNVADQIPLPQTTVSRGTKVNLKLSSGPEKILIEIPDLKDSSLFLAREALVKDKLRLKEIRREPSSTVPSGRVIGQEPSAGSKVEEGAEVTLVVSSGKKEEERKEREGREEVKIRKEIKKAEVSIVIPPGDKSQKVKIVVIDDQGVRTAYEKFHQPEEKVEVLIEGVGKTTVQVYISGELVKEEKL